MKQSQLLKRFSEICLAFKPEDYKNPVTYQSIYEAVENIRKELNDTLE